MTQTGPDAPDPSAGGKTHEARVRLVLVSAAAVLFLASLGQTSVSTALPTIVGQLGGLDHITWVITAYLLAGTVGAPVFGKLGDLFGRRAVLQGGIVIFLIGALVSGTAVNMWMLVAGRFIQGIGGGGLIVVSMAAVADVLPPLITCIGASSSLSVGRRSCKGTVRTEKPLALSRLASSEPYPAPRQGQPSASQSVTGPRSPEYLQTAAFTHHLARSVDTGFRHRSAKSAGGVFRSVAACVNTACRIDAGRGSPPVACASRVVAPALGWCRATRADRRTMDGFAGWVPGRSSCVAVASGRSRSAPSVR